MNLREARRLLLSEAAPQWVIRAAKTKNFKGPNGNEVIAYEWMWKWGERHSRHEDGLVAKRVSDWDKAVPCVTCGRQIVHVYYVKHKDDGKIYTYGRDHLHRALGYKYAITPARAKKLQDKISTKQRGKELRKHYREAADSLAVHDWGLATKMFLQRNPGATMGTPKVLLHNVRDDSFFWVAKGVEAEYLKYLEQDGWEALDPQTDKATLRTVRKRAQGIGR